MSGSQFQRSQCLWSTLRAGNRMDTSQGTRGTGGHREGQTRTALKTSSSSWDHPYPVLPRPAKPGSAPQLLESFGMIPRLPDSSLWGHFLSNQSRLHRDWQLATLLSQDSETQFTLTLPSHRWSLPPRPAPGSPIFPPSSEIYIIDGCFLPSSATTTNLLS